jgi:hypothetical protein
MKLIQYVRTDRGDTLRSDRQGQARMRKPEIQLQSTSLGPNEAGQNRSTETSSSHMRDGLFIIPGAAIGAIAVLETEPFVGFAEDDRSYAVNIQTSIDVVVQKFEDLPCNDVFALRAEMHGHFEKLPQQKLRRKRDGESGHKGDFFAAVADWTLANGLLASLVYREVADEIAGRLQTGKSLVSSENEKRKYLEGKRIFEQHTNLEPSLWQHHESVAYWISKTQHGLWELAKSGRGEGKIIADLIAMKKEAGKRNEPYIDDWILLKENPSMLTPENRADYLDGLTFDGPDTLLPIGGGVQHSFRALLWEYLQYPSTSDPLHTAFHLLRSASNWAEAKHGVRSNIFESVKPPGESLSTPDLVAGMLLRSAGPFAQRSSMPQAAGRCPIVRGGHRHTEPDALFRFIAEKYGDEVVPSTIRGTERLTALHLLVAGETRVFDEIEKARMAFR